MDHEPRNRREAISRKGWQRKDWRLIKLAELPEWRSQRAYGDEIIHI